MKFVLFLVVASIAVRSLMSRPSLGDRKLADSAHPFKSNPYEDILEELEGANLRFAASHVSLMRISMRNNTFIIILKI